MYAYDCVVCKDIALREQFVISEFLNFQGFVGVALLTFKNL